MKLLLLALVVLSGTCAAQLDTIYVSSDKTSYMVFPDTVEFADVGTKAFKAVPRDKMVMLKADPKFPFAPTSLMVKTETSVFVWIVSYKTNPSKLLYTIKSESKEQKKQAAKPITQTELTASTKELIAEAPETPNDVPAPRPRAETVGGRINSFPKPLKEKLNSIYNAKIQYKDIAEKNNNILFQLKNIFVDDKFLYLKVFVENNSSITYEIGIVHGKYIKTNTSSKKTKVSGGTDYSYVYEDSPKIIPPDANENMIYAFPLYAFEDKDKLDITISEEGGKRGLSFRILAKEINLASRL
jgi:hypothetical protein